MDTASAAMSSLLAERIARGDAPAEEQFVGEFGVRVLSMMTARLRDRETARDLAQETLIAVLVALRKNHIHDGAKLASFVYGTARNILNNHFRSCQRVPRCEDFPPDDRILPRQLIVLPQAPGNIDVTCCAIERLDPGDQQVLSMVLVQGLKPAEIAERLSISPEAARARKSRAVKRIAEFTRKLSRRATR